jgi:two-component system cell cycle response regulator
VSAPDLAQDSSLDGTDLKGSAHTTLRDPTHAHESEWPRAAPLAPGAWSLEICAGGKMQRGESPRRGRGVPKKSVAPTRRQSEATIRLSHGFHERETLAALRASLPPFAPITEERPVLEESRAARATPHTLVLPAPLRADRATLTMLRGPSVGTTFTLEREETVLGRGSKGSIVLDEPSVSRVHARITRDGDGAYSIEDMGSTNGTFVGGHPVHQARLRSGDRVQIGGELAFRFAILDEEEETLQRKLYESSTRDSLTGLMNRGYLFESLARAVERSRHDGSDLAVLIVDVDHFKLVNDRFGHAAGDEVLRAISAAGRGVLGEDEVFARYGGEEFSVLTGPARASEAEELGERLRSVVAELRVEVGAGVVGVTVSIGAARLSECEIVDGLELFARADARLYNAKLGGRNRVCACDGS